MIEDALVELVGHVAGDAGFARAGWSVEKRGLTLLSVGNGFERSGYRIHFLRSMHDVSGDERGLEDTRIAYHN